VAQVVLHESDDALGAAGLIDAARDVDINRGDRLTDGPGEIFPRLPELRDSFAARSISHIDVEAASAAGVLGERAGPASCNPLRNWRSLHGRPVARSFAATAVLPFRSGNQRS